MKEKFEKEKFDKEKFDAVLQLLEREDQLTNSRMTWYLTIQGFIIAGVALAYAKDSALGTLRESAITLLSSLGIAISMIVFISVRRARNAKKKVRKKWDDWKKGKVNASDWFPEPAGDTSWWSHLTPGQSVPVILIAFWLAVVDKSSQSVFVFWAWIVVMIVLIVLSVVEWALSKRFGKKMVSALLGAVKNIWSVREIRSK